MTLASTTGDWSTRKTQAMSLINAGRVQEAVEVLDGLVSVAPDDVEAWFLLGAANGSLGRLDAAIRCCRRVVALDPTHSDAHYNLAQACMHQGYLREAVAAYRDVMRLSPTHAVALNNLGYALQHLGKFEEAVECHGRALQLGPRTAEVLTNLGNALAGVGRRDEAAGFYREAIRLTPAHAEAHFNLANVLRLRSESREAMSLLDEAIRLRPGYVEAQISRGLIHTEHGCYDEAEAAFSAALKSDPQSRRARSGLLFCLNYHAKNSKAMYEAHAEWGRMLEASVPRFTHHRNVPDPDRRLRVGYVSPDFRRHSVAHFIEPLLRHHDRAVVEVYCYAHVSRPDAVTAKLRGLADVWRDVTGVPEEAIAEQVRGDGIDVLVDLAGHTAVELLPVFARQPVPVQGTYLGYANTSGLTTMDFRLTDAFADPPGESDALHTETLVRLPGGFLCYEPPPEAAEPYACKGPLTFASFNYLAKATPEVVGLWARILKAVPGSRLVLKSKPLSDPMARDRYLRLFAAHGIHADRLELLGWIATKDSHLVQYNRVHVALDPFPYNGTTTTCEALWMGVPVVTLAGQVHAARVGVSILSHLGLPELIARDNEEYVEIAVRLAQNPDRLAELRRTLRDRMRASPLLDGPAFARAVENAYRERWRLWCAARDIGLDDMNR